MSKTRNKFSPEVRERAVRMVGEHRADYCSAWEAMVTAQVVGKKGLRVGAGDDSNYPWHRPRFMS
ncbi:MULTISPECIES: hypothetical protein [unclassified Novosphingobium]|uniref:hypothetical protein n=1 Tax=unclassified Novosphingobium TaxID=2644732 RepID=UPI001493F778|nr:MULTISPECIES: hypothetical protein [unclassified Novosphingobium]MBB3356213.1 hypothetical protein [Novosphingobium sp. BK256]MBB3372614.1 hypothetical protein [Novosphingobium sp. BK280]MBB3376980.1 hypothetical protein [Novosphingobium sp. BK258]MBB3419607.1 hypothetical protein [Novosphingobium sp. BK267]MBB3448576.1 hypothetical protein [Novosphingobium sp. BK352]